MCKTDMVYKNVKYFWLSLNTSLALLFFIDTRVCTISKVIGINEEEEICLPNREYICHRLEKINMFVKYILHMHIAAELKAYWFLG